MKDVREYIPFSDDVQKRAAKVFRYVFLAAIVYYLIHKMVDIGWGEILKSLPTSPLFYLLFGLIYVSLPITEALIYKHFWHFSATKYLPVFIKKRVYNKDVLGYSGEVYLFSWARQKFDISDRDLMRTIRDNNILSSIASTAIAVLLLLLFLSVGQIRFSDIIGRPNSLYVLTGSFVFVVLIFLAVRHRRHLFSTSRSDAVAILTVHSFRLVVGNALQILMWKVAIPEVPITVWLTFAAASIIVSRVPFVPNRDLIMLGAGIELAELLMLSSASITGLFVALSVLGKIANALWFVIVTFLDKRPSDETVKDAGEHWLLANELELE